MRDFPSGAVRPTRRHAARHGRLRTLTTAAAVAATAGGGAVAFGGVPAFAAAAAPKASQSGSTLTVGVAQFPPGLGNPWTGIGSPGIYEWSAIYDTLTTAEAGGKVVPDLALSWGRTNATTWILHLRSGVSFSDGEPFNASAAAATINYLKSKAGSTNIVADEISSVVGATAVNDTTLKITTAGADAILPNQLSSIYIVAPSSITKGVSSLSTHPIGTGPYKVDSWTQSAATLSAFTGSWRAPKIGHLVFQALTDPTSRLQALESGQIQVAIGMSVQQIPQIKANGAIADVTPSSNSLAFAFVNTGKKKSPIDNVLVRQALNYGVDKQAMVKSLFDNLTTPASQPSNAVGYGYNPKVKPYPYDPTLAKKLLKEAGYPHGFKISAQVVVGSFPEDTQMFEAAAQDLAKIGVTLTLQQVQFSTWLSNYLADTWPGAAFSEGIDTYPELDAVRPMLYLSCAQAPKAFFCDQSVMPRLKVINTVFNAKKRLGLLQSLAVEYHNIAPVLYLCNEIELNGVSTKLGHYRQGANFIIDWNDITIGS